MKDITWDLKEAISKDVLWSISQFFIVIEELQKSKYEVSFWKEEENWASLNLNNEAIGFLWRTYPVMLIVNTYASDIRILLQEFNSIIYIEVSGLTNKELKLNYNSLKDRLEFGINYDSFSAEDLWFGNVSK
jgi:hypothetical protein